MSRLLGCRCGISSNAKREKSKNVKLGTLLDSFSGAKEQMQLSQSVYPEDSFPTVTEAENQGQKKIEFLEGCFQVTSWYFSYVVLTCRIHSVSLKCSVLYANNLPAILMCKTTSVGLQIKKKKTKQG